MELPVRIHSGSRFASAFARTDREDEAVSTEQSDSYASPRRKFQRTSISSANALASSNLSDAQFRRPNLPASRTREDGSTELGWGVVGRRKSTLRSTANNSENRPPVQAASGRVLGPRIVSQGRGIDGSPAKRISTTMPITPSSTATLLHTATSSFLPNSVSEPHFGNRVAPSPSRHTELRSYDTRNPSTSIFNGGRHGDSGGFSTANTSTDERVAFLPALNFDELGESLGIENIDTPDFSEDSQPSQPFHYQGLSYGYQPSFAENPVSWHDTEHFSIPNPWISETNTFLQSQVLPHEDIPMARSNGYAQVSCFDKSSVKSSTQDRVFPDQAAESVSKDVPLGAYLHDPDTSADPSAAGSLFLSETSQSGRQRLFGTRQQSSQQRVSPIKGRLHSTQTNLGNPSRSLSVSNSAAKVATSSSTERAARRMTLAPSTSTSNGLGGESLRSAGTSTRLPKSRSLQPPARDASDVTPSKLTVAQEDVSYFGRSPAKTRAVPSKDAAVSMSAPIAIDKEERRKRQSVAAVKDIGIHPRTASVRRSTKEASTTAHNTPEFRSTRPTREPTKVGREATGGTLVTNERLRSGRVSGLGARTTSPTDARRAKRISALLQSQGDMSPDPTHVSIEYPPMPRSYASADSKAPSISQDDGLGAEQQSKEHMGKGTPKKTMAWQTRIPSRTDPSPSLIPRKTSVTPSSYCTADMGRDSFDQPSLDLPRSQHSLSASSSFQSLRSSLHSMPQDASGLVSNRHSVHTGAGIGSRLPTPKITTRNVWSSSSWRDDSQVGSEWGESEIVPPVPAIPKAWGSPNDQADRPSFFAISSPSGLGSPATAEVPERRGSVQPPNLRLPSDGAAAADTYGVDAETQAKAVVHGYANTENESMGVTLSRAGFSSAAATFRSDEARRDDSTLKWQRRPVTMNAAPPTRSVDSPECGGLGPGLRMVSPEQSKTKPQPLRLPPLMLGPLGPSTAARSASFQRPSQELDDRDYTDLLGTPPPTQRKLNSANSAQTARGRKSPTTPMTASKTSFFSRSYRDDKQLPPFNLRSSSSHYTLRSTKDAAPAAYDYGNEDSASGLFAGKRAAITPFASGSLPKGSGDYRRPVWLGGKPGQRDEYTLGSLDPDVLPETALDMSFLPDITQQAERKPTEQEDSPAMGPRKKKPSYFPLNNDIERVHMRKPSGPRPPTGTKLVKAFPLAEQPKDSKDSLSLKDSSSSHTTSTGTDEPATPAEAGSTNNLRRKISLGWRRSSSKAASGDKDAKGKSPQDSQAPPIPHHVQTADDKSMPPPKLPASATWSDLHTATVPGGNNVRGSGSSRPNLEGWRRKTMATTVLQNTTARNNFDAGEPGFDTANGSMGAAEPRKNLLTQPMSASRSTSWSNLMPSLKSRSSGALKADQTKHTSVTPASSAKAATKSTTPSLASAKDARSPSLSSSNNNTPTARNVRDHVAKPRGASGRVKDKNDLAADEEMRRLALRKPEIESAARFTDHLKARAAPRGPVTPSEAVRLSGHEELGGATINIFERGEIMDFSQVWFVGTKAAKKIVGDISSSSTALASITKGGVATPSAAHNFGYDDERGDFNLVLGDHLAYRYEVVDVLGKGSFGQVVRCVDWKTGGIVAVKIVRNKRRFHAQAVVEVELMSQLAAWDKDGIHATLPLLESFLFRSHLCIVTPSLSMNLYEMIRLHDFCGFPTSDGQGLGQATSAAPHLLRTLARQLLQCLVLLQEKKIIHCDLKPENILLVDPRKAEIRVIDFGSSCRESEKVYTYIQSRFYRSPEVILGASYGLPIDMWSLGCILAELYTGLPLFPGENEAEQLACIIEIFGPPPQAFLAQCTRKKVFFDSSGKPRISVNSKGRRRRPSSKTLGGSMKCEDEILLDFLTRCLRWDPEKRMRADEAMNHPFVTGERAPRVSAVDRARTRSMAVNGGSMSSPIKRTQTVSAVTHSTPMREKDRVLPETPNTSLRNGVPTGANVHKQALNGSPIKFGNRRHSQFNVGLSGAAAAMSAGGVAGSKRAVNGTLPHGESTVRSVSAKVDMASAAARESMRWR
ncbi:serine/threonine protein kinase, CMGC, dual-specificity [Elasticomyces elasticus]|nr:serine/threonine protein kinase, CMGC, dual-specificity [Elasticomyces elasticus]